MLQHLQLTLRKIIQELNDDVYIIIDSLDECSERSSLLTWITELSDQKDGKLHLHLLVTSRPEYNIRTRLATINRISMDIVESQVSQDLEKFVDEKIQDSSELRKLSSITDIRTAVMTDAHGMFSLVAYRLHELQSCVSLGAVKKKLKDLPRNLDQMYHRIVNKLEPMYQGQVLLILQWLAFSKRALTLREIAVVVPVTFSGSKAIEFDPDCRLVDPKEIFGICGAGEVKISHLSIKEYILSNRRQGESSPLYSNASLAHCAITQTCLVYLSELTGINELHEIESNFPLARNWFSHATYTDEDGEPNLS